jgi:hypothetical protein
VELLLDLECGSAFSKHYFAINFFSKLEATSISTNRRSSTTIEEEVNDYQRKHLHFLGTLV